MKIVTLVFLFIASLILAIQTWGAPKSEPIYYYPSSARLASKIVKEYQKFDNLSVPMLRLFVMGTQLEVPYSAGYTFASSQLDRWNATFVLPERPSVRWGIAVFRWRAWLPDLSSESIRGYLRGLERTPNISDIQSSLNEELEVDLSILGEHPQAVSYTLNKTTKRIEYLLNFKGQLWIFGFEAPADLFESNVGNMGVIWSRIARANPRR